MPFEYDERKGSLFKQENAEEGQPVMTGGCKIEGKTYKVAGWANESKKTGKKYLGLSFQLDEGEPEDAQGKGAKANPTSDSELPF
tara:strand:+ start:580 stop:834 length:255 start_codon:yes stop_codon:yes gene_type:complete